MEGEKPARGDAVHAQWGSDYLAVMRALGLEYVTLVPGASYRGLHDSLVNYLGNTRPTLLLSLHDAQRQSRRGRIAGEARIRRRTPAAPDIPTVAESGIPGYEVSNWFGVSAPARTPPEIVSRLHDSIARALKMPDVRAALSNGGAEPAATTADEYAAFFRNEYTKWSKVIKAAGIKGE